MNSNPASENFLTELMLFFKTSIVAGAERILPDALWLLTTLATIELALALILNRDEDPLLLITHKFAKFSFFFWLVNNWATGMNLTQKLFDMFQYFGVTAALGSGGNGVVGPAKIGEIGIHLTDSLNKSIFQISGTDAVMGNIGLILVKIAVMFVIMACFFWMALQLFLTCVEFYLTSTLTVVLIPFSANRHTGFIGEKAIGAVLSFCIKVMVLQFILCIAIPVTEQWTLEVNNKDLTPLFRALFGCVALAFLTWKAPEYAQGLLSGSPSFSAGEAVGGARAVTGAVVGGATGAAGVGLRVAGFSQAAMNATGGRCANAIARIATYHLAQNCYRIFSVHLDLRPPPSPKARAGLIFLSSLLGCFFAIDYRQRNLQNVFCGVDVPVN